MQKIFKSSKHTFLVIYALGGDTLRKKKSIVRVLNSFKTYSNIFKCKMVDRVLAALFMLLAARAIEINEINVKIYQVWINIT